MRLQFPQEDPAGKQTPTETRIAERRTCRSLTHPEDNLSRTPIERGAAPVTSEAQTHHAIDYIELAVTNMDDAKRFYESAFQWEFNAYGPEYAGIRKKRGEGEAGGLRLSDHVTTGGPLVILYSENLEQSLEAVRQAGGVITTEPFSFPGGRRFQFCDPSGNELAVWSDK